MVVRASEVSEKAEREAEREAERAGREGDKTRK